MNDERQTVHPSSFIVHHSSFCLLSSASNRTEVSIMRRFTWSIVTLGAILALTAPVRADLLVRGTFSGAQEVPPNFITPATGLFVGNLHQVGATTSLMFTITYNDLIGGDVVAANFNDAPPGSNGPDVKDYDPGLFTSPDGTFMGTWDSSDPVQPLTPALLADLFAGKIYFEIDTQEFPGEPGEIRAQLQVIAPAPPTLGLAVLGAAGVALARWRRGRTIPHSV
jgi:hypothetical protein